MSESLTSLGGAGEAPVGSRIERSLRTPAGTEISRIRYWRTVNKMSDPGDHWSPYIAVGDRATIVDTCEIGNGSTCVAGADDWFEQDPVGEARASYRDLPDLRAGALLIGLLCRPNPDGPCGAGSTLAHAQVEIFSAFLTISDPVAPLIGTPSGVGWSADGWVGGTLPLAVASMDNIGIAATKVYVDGSVVGTLQRACSYDRPKPCTDEPTGAVGLPTGAVGDGVHSVKVGVVDAAGNETVVQRPQAIKIDNNAPGAPVGLVSPAPVSVVDRFAVHWSLPADSGSPIAEAKYQVCQAGSCGAVLTAPSLMGVEDVQLPQPGDGVVRVWLRDSAGHEDPATAAQLALRYVPEPAAQPVPSTPIGGGGQSPVPGATPLPPVVPQPSVDPPAHPPTPNAAKKDPALRIGSVRVDGRQVLVRGSLSSRASGRVAVRFSGTPKRGKKVALLARAAIRSRRFSATLVLPRRAVGLRIGTVVVSYAGDPDTRSATRRSTVRWRPPAKR